MLLNVRNDRAFQKFLDRREQELHVAMVPLLGRGIRMMLKDGSIPGTGYVLQRGEKLLVAHYKRVFREVYSTVEHRFAKERNPNNRGVNDFLDSQLGYLEREGAKQITNIAGSLADWIRDQLIAGVREGRSNDAIASEIWDDTLDISRDRAATIARTETHGSAMWALDETLQEKSIEVQKKRWWSSLDSRVRPAHAAMHGVEVSYDQPFETDDGDCMYPGDDSLGIDPGGIINCLSGDAIISSTDIRAATRHVYHGKLVEIRTARSVLKTTPNHPIATPRGWIAAGRLNVGDDVLYLRSAQFRSAPVVMDSEHRPAMLEQIFETLAAPRFVERVPTTAVNFHGDRPNSDIDIVLSDSTLLGHRQPSAHKRISNQLLSAADTGTGAGVSDGFALQFMRTGFHPAPRIIGGHSVKLALLRGALSRQQSVGLLSSQRQRSVVDDNAANGAAAQTKLTGNPRFWPTEAVQRHKIVDLRISQTPETHVYNLDTGRGYYAANGILVHNCRCSVLYTTETLPSEDETDTNY